MLSRLMVALFFVLLVTFPAQARRVALVIGQDAYPGGSSAAIGLPPLNNSRIDGRSMAALLRRYGFDVMSCDGRNPGCFDLKREELLKALATFENQARGADLALVYYAGHGLASEEGNILAPLDARVACDTGAVTFGVPVERLLEAADAARNKLVILDACRDNPIGAVCPRLKGRKLAFSRIEAGAMEGLLLVTSTQFGQQTLDGDIGGHSPFAASLLASLEAHPNIYFEQLMNDVARLTYEAAKQNGGFVQIPGKVVGGVAPADCLAGRGCVGDERMASLARENENLATDAAGVRNILAAEEQARGKPYSKEEREKRVAELGATLARIASSTDPLRVEARRLIDAGNVKGGEAKLDEALDADEKAIAEAERVASEKRKAAATSARDLAELARGRDVMKAISYYRRAVRLFPENTDSLLNLGETALDAGLLDEAAESLDQAEQQALSKGELRIRYWSLIDLGVIAQSKGSLTRALERYQAAEIVARDAARTEPKNSRWQRDSIAAQSRIGDVQRLRGDPDAALESYRQVLAHVEGLVKAEPNNPNRANDLSIALQKVGDAELELGRLNDARASFKAALDAAEKAIASDANYTPWQTSFAIADEKLADVLTNLGKNDEARKTYEKARGVWEKLVKTDPHNTEWQHGNAVIIERLGNIALDEGKNAEALKYYRENIERLSPLRDRDPANVVWQRFILIEHMKIGDVQRADNDLAAAMASFKLAHAGFAQLIKDDPGNSDWQRNLAIANERIGSVAFLAKDNATARRAFEDALKAYEAALDQRPGDHQMRLQSVVPHVRLAEIDAHGPAARKHIEAALAILKPLAAQGHLDTMRLGWIPSLEKRLAEPDATATTRVEPRRAEPGKAPGTR